MKTQVTLNQNLIKNYYKDLFLVKYLALEILILIVGSIASFLYLFIKRWAMGFALEFLTLVFAVIIYLMNHNEMVRTITYLNNTEKFYDFEFEEDLLKITHDSNETEIPYKELKVSSLPHLFVFKKKIKNSSTLYIIPKNSFSIDEWKEIKRKIESKVREK